MPLVWIGISALTGIISGIVYEKESGETVVQQTTESPSFSWWDKTLMAAAGIAAYYIYKKVK